MIRVVVGSTRPGRRGESVARWVTDTAAAHPTAADGRGAVEVVELAAFDLPLLDEPVPPRSPATPMPTPAAGRTPLGDSTGSCSSPRSTGVAWLVLESGAPVVPVAITGTGRIQPVGARLPRLGRITVRFGQPLSLTTTASRSGNQARWAVTDQIVAAIGLMFGQERAQEFADLPD